ncbi:hypothetical protein [Thermococcus sp.]|uniref:hypothetical protein n=1 Tax=Thermococcus sp. TaxID=35749 RepID=UPI00261FA468|nr:hypothetical protein [Thermococcus sp.]
MGKVITIRVPDWVGDDFVKRIEKLIEEEIERAFSSGRVDRETYLKFVETYGSTESVFLENEEKLLEEMRKREKARADGSH